MSLLKDLRRITGENDLSLGEQESKIGTEQVDMEAKKQPIPIIIVSMISFMTTFIALLLDSLVFLFLFLGFGFSYSRFILFMFTEDI